MDMCPFVKPRYGDPWPIAGYLSEQWNQHIKRRPTRPDGQQTGQSAGSGEATAQVTQRNVTDEVRSIHDNVHVAHVSPAAWPRHHRRG